MPFGVAAAAITAGGAIASGAMQSSAAGDAMDAQMQGQMMAIAQKDKALQEAQNALVPYENSGYGSQSKLDYLLGTSQPLSVPTKADFRKKDSLGNPIFDEFGYKQALNHYAAQAQQFGLPQMPDLPSKEQYRRPVYNKAGKITGYKFNNTAYKQALTDYKVALQSFYDKMNSPQGKEMLANATRQGQGGDNGYGSLLQNFGEEQYKKDPGYTPMVNDLASLQATPGYDFRLQQGEQGINRAAAAKGGLLGGAQLKALDRYNQDYASNEYQNAWERAQNAYNSAFNRFQNNKQTTYNMLSTQGARGQQAASGMAGNAMQSGNLGAQIATNTADNMSTLNLAQGNAWGNAITGAANAIAGGVSSARGWGNGAPNTQAIGANYNPGTAGVLYPGASL